MYIQVPHPEISDLTRALEEFEQGCKPENTMKWVVLDSYEKTYQTGELAEVVSP